MRTFKIENNPRLKELLETKQNKINKCTEYQKEMQAVQEKLKAEAESVDAVKQDIMLAAYETVMAECSDNEMAGTITLNDAGEVVVEIFDVVEEQLKQTAEEKQKLANQMIDLKNSKKKKEAKSLKARAKKKK